MHGFEPMYRIEDGILPTPKHTQTIFLPHFKILLANDIIERILGKMAVVADWTTSAFGMNAVGDNCNADLGVRRNDTQHG